MKRTKNKWVGIVGLTLIFGITNVSLTEPEMNTYVIPSKTATPKLQTNFSEITAPNGKTKHQTLTVVGASMPYRPEVIPVDDEEKKYAARWKEMIPTITPDKMVELLEVQDAWRYRKHIQSGLSPWIVRLEATENNLTTHCIPGGVIEVEFRAVWENPIEGYYDHTLTPPKVTPSWEIINGPFNFIGWFQIRKGDILVISKDVLVRVPDNCKLGQVTLRASGEAKGPANDGSWTETKDFRLLIEPLPRPDRETLLSFWGYVVEESNTVCYLDRLRDLCRKKRKLAMHAVEFLKLFATQLDGDMQILAKELLDHSAFKKAVNHLEKEEKKDKLSAKDDN